MNNTTWAKLIIEELRRQGVRHFCLAPGSRSTPLALAICEEEKTIHFDERSLGFYALGDSKASGRPVAIIVTSGTAVGNLMPSVMEAWHDHVPLILLTADRPPELRECGANQTTDQVKIFSSFVHLQVDLPCPFSGGEDYLASMLSYGVHLAKQNQGPVHFNCMFREPLCTPLEPLPQTHATHYHPLAKETFELPDSFFAKLSQHKQGIVICGQDTPRAALQFAERLQWPLFAEINSGLRGLYSRAAIPYYEHLLKSDPELKPSAILHFGGRLLSKTLTTWCQKLQVPFYAHIDSRRSRFDPYLLVTHRYFCDIDRHSMEQCSQNIDSSWLDAWQDHALKISQQLQFALSSQEVCTEPGLFHLLRDSLNDRCTVFLANSMPIRDASFFLFPEKPIGRLYGNRGLSGIDGNIATIAGIAHGSGQATIGVIGDQTALHDLSSLPLIAKSEVPILLIVINNAGGGIFSFLPHLKSQPRFEELFAHRHSWEFSSAAAMFSLPYSHPTTPATLAEIIHNFCQNPTTTFLELQTDRTANHILHEELEETVIKKLCLIKE